MKYSGLYHIHASSPELATSILTNLTTSLERKFNDFIRLGPWGLSHRLLRSQQTPPRQNAPTPQPQETTSYIHILQLSYLGPGKASCYVQKPLQPTGGAQTLQNIASGTKGPGTVITIPASQAESHINLLAQQFSPLWAFRHALMVQNGVSYGVGMFHVHIGELRSFKSNVGAAPGVGVVVCITINTRGDRDPWAKDEEEEIEDGFEFLGGTEDMDEELDFSDLQTTIRPFWDMMKEGVELGRGEVKEMMMAEEVPKDGNQNEAIVRMWCEVLRLRA